MKLFYLFFVSIIILFSGCRTDADKPEQNELPELKIFSIHSYIWEKTWKESYNYFTEYNNCSIDFTLFENSCQMVEALQEDPDVDVVIGLDNINYLVNDLDSLFQEYDPEGKDRLKKSLLFADNSLLIPIAYGDLGFIINQEEVPDPPYTFGIMQDGMFKRKLLFPDPHSSSLGKAFLLWSIAAFGTNGYGHFWRSIQENIHTTTSNWDEAYNMFLAGEAPIVLAYTTIPYYHQLHDSLQIYSSLIPSEGGFRIIETAGIYHKTKNLQLSRKLIDFLISDPYQKSIIRTHWLRPVSEVELPAEIAAYPRLDKDLTDELSRKTIKNNFTRWLKRWTKLTAR